MAKISNREFGSFSQMNQVVKDFIGSQIREERKENSWTQEQIIEQLKSHGFEMSIKTLYDIERGTGNPSISNYIACLQILNIKLLLIPDGTSEESVLEAYRGATQGGQDEG